LWDRSNEPNKHDDLNRSNDPNLSDDLDKNNDSNEPDNPNRSNDPMTRTSLIWALPKRGLYEE